MKRALTSIITLMICVSLARANVWEQALATDQRLAARETYESELRKGDEHALLANNRGIAPKEVEHHLGLAIAAYHAAAAARPTVGEPYFRLGRLLYSFYIECHDAAQRYNRSPLCNPRQFKRARAREIIEAWDAFEQRVPLDPRLSVGAFGETEILFRRAILHTKLGSKENLAAAARDYEKILARHDSGSDAVSEEVVGNLAETYMMLGQLEEAIEMYREALRNGSDTSTWYGFAVALDRDERTKQALDVIRSLGRDQRDRFHAKVIEGRTFFVPEGEKYYYFALVDEALGLDEDAIAYWQRFIASGAHPQYQPRAKAHLDALLKKKRKSPLPIDPPWGRLLR
jgi:tetratricopeptide (TPR) repeat protein